MFRSIKMLRPPARAEDPVKATPEEISAAALQFVRKISGYHKPAKANSAAFEGAVEEIAAASARLLQRLDT